MTEHANVAAYLPEMARRQPDALAVAVARGRGSDGSPRFTTMTAAELNRRSDRIAHALVSLGIGEGVRTVLMVPPSPEFFALTFAMLKVGAVPVLVDPGMGVRNLGACLAQAEPTAFVGSAKAHLARRSFGWARTTLKTRIGVGWTLGLAEHSLAALEAGAPDAPYPALDPAPAQLAAILFTSGGTGPPKGVLTPFSVFAAQLRLLRETFGIEPGERDLSTFPLFALFGPALGMASIVPDMDASRPARADPNRLVEACEAFACTNLFASPALIDKLGRHCERRGLQLASLRRAISAGAPASMPAIERFSKALTGGAEIFTPYGATEALPVAVLGSRALLGETRAETESGGGVCVGLPVAGMEVRIVRIDDAPIPQWSDELELPRGEVGEIVVRGPVVTPGYHGRPDATAMAKIADGSGPAWHRMGDVGRIDERGRLWMCGRKVHRVVVGDATMFTIPCEAPFRTHPAVFRAGLVGVHRNGQTVPVLCVEREPGHPIADASLRAELAEIAARHVHTRAIRTFLFHPGFPVDVRHNAKIFREQLAVWAEDRVP